MRLLQYNILILLVVVIGKSEAQLNAGTFGKVNIASPNAAALGKYGDIPVNYHTGVPNISIPLYTLKEGNLSLPIQLSYHAGGLKVDENASWVGAGWSLMAGGAITRTVKDKPDERRSQSMQQLYGHFSNYGLASYILNNDAGDENYIDQEPDLFSFNFNGYSGKFYFDDTRKPILYPEQDFKIEYVYKDELWSNAPGYSFNGGLGKSIESFTITIPDGTKYFFGIPDQVIPNPYCAPVEVVSTFTLSDGSPMGKIISSWYLYKVVSSDGVNQINLLYKPDSYAFYSYPSSVYAAGSSNNNIYYAVKNLMSGVQLSRITTSSNAVELIGGGARQDIASWTVATQQIGVDNVNTSSPVLGSIKIYDTGSFCIKKYNFSYSYFEDNATPTSNYFSWVNTDRKRLKLNSVQELSGDDAIIIPPYSFEYFNELVPRKMSFGKDHWGYINGANSNTMLYPEVFDNRGSLNTILDISINNRESAWPAMRGGSLKRINYPTGGYSDFEFEPNTTSVNGIDKMVGGLRVKSITTVDPVMNNNNKMEFEYTKAGMSTSSGILFSKPTYIQLLRNDWAKKTNMFAAVVSGGNGCPASFPDNSIQLREFILSDNSVRPMETTQGYHIGYGTVKVKRENNGYSRYVYNVNVPIQISWGSSMVTNYANNPGTCDANISSYPAAPIAFDPYRGDLLSETHFSNAGILVQEKAYETYYQQSNKSVFGRIVHKLGISTGPNAFYTYYGYKTARKGQTTIIEKNFDPNGTFIQNTTQTLFESPFHNEPTTTVSYNSFGDTLMKKNRYAFDIRSTQFDTTNNCNNASADFLSFVDQIFYSSGYNAQFANLNGNFSSYLALMNSFNQAVFNPRKALTQCTLSGIDSYQPKHDLVKGNADVNLKPIMWMQDIYKNALLETSEWKNDKLLRSVFVQHANERDDDFGVYPVKLKKIELLNTSASFTPVATASNNTGLNIDTRYNELTTINYLKGNPNNQLGRDGVNTAYDWNYNNQSPIVKVVNAYNLRRESSEIGIINKSIKFTLGSSFSNTGSAEVSFYHLGNADINFSLGTTPPGAKVTALYILTGPTQNAVQYNLCSGNGSAPSCNNISSSATLTNMPAGLYTLSINVSTTFDSYQFSNYPANYSYLGKSIITIGTKEYFYEGFEDALIPNSGLAYTGTKSYNGTYVLNFVPPNNRNYILQWWNYANGKWNFNQQPYTGTTSISGIIDEIRIFPEDAQMTTYAYDSRYGLIGICDMNNRITSYEYDRLGRLKLVRDQDGNIVKTIDYNYKN